MARCKADVLEIKNLQHILKVNLTPRSQLKLKESRQLSDQDICNILKLAEGLPVMSLDLTLTRFSGAGLALGGHNITLPLMEKLRVTLCRNLTDTSVRELLTTSGLTLKRLDLSQTSISNAALEGIQLPQLEHLNLSFCRNLTDTGVQELLTTNGTRLKQLDLGWTEISDAALEGVQLPQLEVLDLCGCSHLTDTGLQQLLTPSGTNLTDLNLRLTGVSGAMLVNLVAQHPPGRLRKLWLSYPTVSAADIARIRNLLPSCKLNDT